jgi:hypothetical protein
MLIKKTHYGIASRVGDTIYINEALENKYPRLYQALITHEQNHSGSISLKDLFIDVGNVELKDLKKEYYSFILTHPSSWSEFLPFWIIEGKFQINITLLVFYIIVVFFGVLLFSSI